MFRRSYISFDILRRVLSDYFGYNIQYVMNITDIDDKIIKRARQNHLFKMYADRITEMSSLDQMMADQKEILVTLNETVAKNTDPDKKPMLEKMLQRLKDVMKMTEKKAQGEEDLNAVSLIKDLYLKDARDSIADWLDKRDGHTVNDNHIFEELPKYWENKFHEDMTALNVRGILKPSSFYSNEYLFLLFLIDRFYLRMY